MIRFTNYGGATVAVGASPWLTQVPQPEAKAYVTERIEKGTVLFAIFGAGRLPDHRDPATWTPSRNWFYPDTPDRLPVYDSQGNAWQRDFPTSPYGSMARKIWRCIVTTPLDPANEDWVAASFIGFQNGPTRDTPGWEYGHYDLPLRPINYTASAGFTLIGFSCLGPFVLADLALSGHGADGANYRYPGEVIDTTPLGGPPYAPRLQLAIYGVGRCTWSAPSLYPALADANTGSAPASPGYTIPDGWTSAGSISSNLSEHHVYDPGLLDTPELIAYYLATIAGTISFGWNYQVYYRVVPPGTVEDTITLGAATWAGDHDAYAFVTLAVYQVREIPCPAAGVDLLQTQTLHLFRSGASDADVQVERSGTAGATWDAPVTVASDAGPSTTPTLTRNSLDQVWCWYHNASGNAQAYLSKDLGATWAHYASHAGKHFPRACRQFHRTLLCAHDGTTLRVYQSDDDGLTLEELPGLALECPEQLAAFAVDRHDTPHLVLTTAGGAIVHRYLGGDDTWSSPATLAASGSHPALALGLRRGLLLYWDGGTLHALHTDETFGAVGDAASAPTGFTPGYLGALVDHQELHHYVAGLDESGRVIRYSGDDAATWHTPA